ncbi:MAG TPA: TetR family transcriptional regulator, partial [Acidimicrobiia bacterium]|nr:TetR family transcriptional regulator [Acidimicrobiia bacterium]
RTPRGQARLAILDATLQLVAANGVDSVTHRRVAEMAGVSPGSTTHHFDTREDLLRGAFRHYLHLGDRLLTTINEDVARAISDPAGRVVACLSELLRREFTDERLVRAEYEMMLFASGDPELSADLRRWEARWASSMAVNLEVAGAARPVEAARALINLVRGFELERLLDPLLQIDQFSPRANALLSAYLAAPAAPE